MKRFFQVLSLLILFGVLGYFLLPKKVNPVKNGQIVINQAKISDYHTVQTKLAGNKNYSIYRNVCQKGGVNAFTSTKYFRKSLLQSQHSAKTRNGTFWQLVANGRTVGWVNEKFFRRNEISIAHNISLVRNNYYAFPTRDAISYAVDKHGTLIAPDKVHVSRKTISSAIPGTYLITYSYHGIRAKGNIVVRTNTNEGVTVADKTPISGPAEVSTFSGSSKSSSRNWNWENNYQPETKINTYHGKNGATMKTIFYQPRFHLLDYQSEDDQLNQVGVIPEGISLLKNQLTVSYFSKPNSTWGHLVTYNLNQLTDPIKTQNLLNMNWDDFVHNSQNISVSPYLKLGHGQSLGMTRNYLYVLASSNREDNSAKSEELLQISRRNYQIKNLWTIKVWNRSEFFPRYFHNAFIVNDHLIYAVFHNASKGCYEYWRLTRQGNSWIPTEISATQSNFVKNNSPLQGFTYANDHFYLAFNDNLFEIDRSGKVLKHYQFHTLRETEGIAVGNDRPYVELARRPELLVVK